MFITIIPSVTANLCESGRLEIIKELNEDSSSLLTICRTFNDELFLEETYFKKYDSLSSSKCAPAPEFTAFFPEKENRYLKVKLLCGALIEIDDNLKSNNLEKTVEQINEEYEDVVNIDLEYTEIFEIKTRYKENENMLLHHLTTYIKDEIEGGVT